MIKKCITLLYLLSIAIGAHAVAVDVTVTKQTTLETAITSKVSDLETVTQLTVHGPLDDYAMDMWSQMPNLEVLDLGDAQAETFSGCFMLMKLRSVVLPSNTKVIDSQAFYYCTSLEDITLPATTEEVGFFAFGACVKLKTISLPSSFNTAGGHVFTGCTALTDVYCYSADYNGTLLDDFNGESEELGQVTLHVHSSLVDHFRQKENFEKVTVVGMDFNFSALALSHPTTVTDISNYQGANVSFRMGQETNMETFETKYAMGSLTLDAPTTPTWQVGNFSLPVSYFDYETNYDYENFENSEKIYEIATLLNRRTPVEARQVEIKLSDTQDETWLFFSVPFDVKVSDIQFGRGQWTIRRYDPTARAAVQSGWTVVGEDDTLHAGEGYVFMRNYRGIDTDDPDYAAEDNPNDYRLILTAAETASKQNIFVSDDVVVPLKKSSAMLSHNASWNFVGNPYPCYFDISAIKEPVTVYIFDEDEGLYQSFDTSTSQGIVLAPCQTFFVQGTDVSQLTFQAKGRKAQSSFGIPEMVETEDEESMFSDFPAEIRQRLKATPTAAATDFNPDSPLDPGANYFNVATGEAYFDLFPKGRFVYAVRDLFGNDLQGTTQLVKSITITAPMSENDFLFMLMPNAEKVDMQLSSGFQKITDGAFAYMVNLKTLVLPSCVTSIADKAFGDASMYMKGALEQLDLYATTPPTVTQKVFDNLKDKSNLVVRVPKEGVAAYKAANVWKDLNILPLEGGGEELQSVTLVVKAPDGTDLTNQCNILWTDAEGELLGTGTTLTAQPIGSTVNYSIGLSTAIAALYVPVPTGTYTIQSANNIITINLMATGVVDMGGKQLLGSNGTLEVTFVASDSEAPTVFNSGDLLLSIINKTSGEAITDFVLQYPNVTFEQTQLVPGQTLLMGVTSRSNLFQGAQTEATVDADGAFTARLTIKEWGQATITCTLAEGVNGIMALVFDQDEKYVARFNGNSNVVRVKDLPDGTYSVVVIQQNQYLNAVASLADLRQTVLREGTDYALLPIQLSAGNTRQYSTTVPALDVSRISHISPDSYVTTNDPEVNIASNATLKAKVVFKEEYAAQVSNLQLIIDIPDGLQFVENSVIAKGGSYQLTGQRLIIPCQQGEQVRWCLTSNKSGQKTVTAMVQYLLAGQQYLQPIGSANIDVTGMVLDVASTTNVPRISVQGKAYGGSHVTIYDGRAIVAETTALSDGSFSANITLNPALDGTHHQLYADIVTSGQPDFSTETSTVLYDKQASVLDKVTMLYQNQRITWDEKTCAISPFYFNVDPSASPTATFTARFINPKPNCILDPYFQVGASDGSYRTFDATWNEALQLYTAVADYPDTYRLPVSVLFLYTYADSTAYSRQEIFEAELNALVSAHNQLVDGIQNTVQVGDPIVDEDDRLALNFKIGDSEDFLMDLRLEDYDRVISLRDDQERPFIRSIVEGDTVASFFIINNERSTTLYFANLNKHEAYSETIESPSTAAGARKISFGGIINGIKSFVSPSNLQTANELIDKANGKLDEANEALEALNYIDEMQRRYDEFNNDLSNRINILQYLLLARCPNGDLRVPPSMYGSFQEAIRRLDSQRQVFCKQMQGLILSYANALENAGYKEIAKELAKFVAKFYASKKLSTKCTALANNMAATGMASAAEFGELLSNGIDTGIDTAVDWVADQITKGRIPTDYKGVRAYYEKWTPQEYHKISTAVTNLKFSITGSYKKCEEEEEIQRPPVPWAKKKRRVRPIIDPSGYVYEATPDNRVEGVAATIYFKENEGAAEQLWNAEEYGQQNPQLTDAAGIYMWNVPQGLWQVRFQKAGYQTSQTDWLPVPPPQLEIAVPMIATEAPAVADAAAYTDGVSIRFTQFMRSESLSAVSVSQNGQVVTGRLEAVEAQDGMARHFRFVPAAPFTAETVSLTIPATAANYVGTALNTAYSATLTVEHTIEGLVVQEQTAIQLGQTGYVSVTAYPAVAVSGKVLSVSTTSPLVKIVGDELRFDSNGQCMVPVSALLPGMADITVAIGDLKAQATVEVKYRLTDVCAMPIATIASGTAVVPGTRVELYCATEGATIYYTTDGSCPCDEQTRLRYTGPIVVNTPMTIQAIAVCEGKDDSEVVTLTYTVDASAIDLPALDDSTLTQDFYYSLRGSRVMPPLKQGMYIHVRRSPQGVVSRKIIVK